MGKLVLLLLAVTLLVIAPTGVAHACSGQDTIYGCIEDDTTGEEIILAGQASFPGSPTRRGASISIPQPRFTKTCLFDRTACERDPEPVIPTITISDIATFRPTPGSQQMQPDGWTIAGLDTNFFAITDSHVVNGTLLGQPADVRFTPVSFRWAYGDGSAAVKPTKGGTWAALGVAEFDPTPTSHVYEQLGDYTITLTITFAAEYRFAGSGWRPVVGTITLPANDLHLRVGTAQTVLVEHDCTQNPGGPGC